MFGVMLLAGCVSYEPSPIDLNAVVEDHGSRTLDVDDVRRELENVAPEYTFDGNKWDALGLLAAALLVNPDLARTRAAVVAAQAEAATARVAPGPTLALTAEYAFNPTEPSNWLYGLVSDLLLDRGGRRQGRIEAADIAARSAEYDYAAAVWSVRMAIRRAVDARAMAEARAGAADALVAMRERQFEAENRRLAAGAISRFELDRVRRDLASERQTALEARHAVARAEVDLVAAVGLAPGRLDTQAIDASVDDARSALPALTDTQLSDALELRTEILNAVAAYDRAEADLRVAVASQYPALSLGPGYTWERGLRKLPFGLSLSFPSRDRGRSQIAAAEARREEAGRGLEAAVAGVESTVAQADADYRSALDVLELVREQALPTAMALAAQAERELTAGAINRADWAAAQAGLLATRLDEINALAAVIAAEAALEDALRQPLAGPETLIGPTVFEPSKEETP